MNPARSPRVYKVAPRAAWEAACREGALSLTGDDARDGFIHLSAPQQLAGTLAKHFKGQTDLVLIELDAAALGDDLRWEPSRGGELFPHLYGPLPVPAARAVQALQVDQDGTPRVPESIWQC